MASMSGLSGRNIHAQIHTQRVGAKRKYRAAVAQFERFSCLRDGIDGDGIDGIAVTPKGRGGYSGVGSKGYSLYSL